MERGEYYRKFGWGKSPFIKSTSIDIPIIERASEFKELEECISGWDRVIAITAPIGYGKTTFMNQLIKNKPGSIKYLVSFDAYEPSENVMKRMVNALPIWKRFALKNTDMTVFGSELQKKLGDDKMLLVFDESQDYDTELLKWLRMINDRAENVFMIFLGLPGLEDHMTSEASFRDRKSKSIRLKTLTSKNLESIIKQRIRWVGGGKGSIPFTEEGLSRLCASANNVPRLLMENGQRVIEECAHNDVFEIGGGEVEMVLGGVDSVILEPEVSVRLVGGFDSSLGVGFLGDLSPTQREIVLLLRERDSLSIPEICDLLDKDIRSVGSLIRKLRGLNKAEVSRKPNVPYPVVVRSGKDNRNNRMVHVYSLSDNARRALAT